MKEQTTKSAAKHPKKAHTNVASSAASNSKKTTQESRESRAPAVQQSVARSTKLQSRGDTLSESWIWLAYFLAFLFVYSVGEKIVDMKAGIVGSPNAYAALPALVIALIVWRANRTKSTYTGMIIVLSVIATSLALWLFGVTGASSLLYGR